MISIFLTLHTSIQFLIEVRALLFIYKTPSILAFTLNRRSKWFTLKELKVDA